MVKTTACTVGRAVALGFGLMTSACGPEPARQATLAELKFVEVTASPDAVQLSVGHAPGECLTFPGLRATIDGVALARFSPGESAWAPGAQPTLEEVILSPPNLTDCLQPAFAGFGAAADGVHTLSLSDDTQTRELTFRVGALSSVRVVSPSDGVLRQDEVAALEYSPAELNVSVKRFDLDEGGGVQLGPYVQPRVPGTVQFRVGSAANASASLRGSFAGTLELSASPGVLGCTFSDCTLVGRDSTFQLKSTFEGHAPDGGV